jgi:nucleoside-diphosphate-sugar epimerase
VNTEGTARVADAIARSRSAPARLVLLSSLAALGPNRNGEALSPETVPYPVSHYGHSKLLAELVLHSRADRVPITILRLPSVYGPRERGVLAFFRMVWHGVALTVGPWSRELSMIFVTDAVQGILAAATSPNAIGRTYCLAHPVPVTWTGFADAVGQALGRRPRLVSVPPAVGRMISWGAEACARLRGVPALLNSEKLREIVQPRWVCDPMRAIREFGFQPVFEIARGTEITAAWYRQAGWL